MFKFKYSIRIGNETPKTLVPYIRVGQGRRFSPTLASIDYLSMPIWEVIGSRIMVAKDCCSLVSGK